MLVNDDVDVGDAGDVVALVVVGVGIGVCGGRRGDRNDGAVVAAAGHVAAAGVVVVISCNIRISLVPDAL